MKKHYLLIFGFCLFIANCRSKPVVQLNSPSERLPSSGRSETQGPIDDCLNHAFIYARYDGLTSECTMNYVHFFSDKSYEVSQSNKKIRIGSFNLFHLGDSQAPLKSLTAVASIMNQWDLVGAQELMPLPTEMAISNHIISELVEKTGTENDFYRKNLEVDRPGYLLLLKELRQLDPSWALILQPMAEGEGSSGEMAGFYYRSSAVKLKDWNYCPKERSYDLKTQAERPSYGCLVQLSPVVQSLVSRRAFVTQFQSGKFAFVGMTSHVRFRAADTQAALDQQKLELCLRHRDPAKCKPTKEDVGRYYEVKAAADEIVRIQHIAQNNNVIFMGDFNLELNDRSLPYWQAALKNASGFEVYQAAPTTLAVQKNTLKSNYDHFIFNPQELSECSVASIKSFNFTSKEQGPTSIQDIIAKAAESETVRAQIALRMSEIEKTAKAKVSAKSGVVTVGNLSPVEVEECRLRFEGTVRRINTNFVGAMLELISDHLPIEIECQTDGESE